MTITCYRGGTLENINKRGIFACDDIETAKAFGLRARTGLELGVLHILTVETENIAVIDALNNHYGYIPICTDT